MCWTYFKTIGHRPVTRGKGSEAYLANLFAPPGNICWAYLETIGHSLKILGPSQKTLRHPCCPKLVTGLGKTVRWIGFFDE